MRTIGFSVTTVDISSPPELSDSRVFIEWPAASRTVRIAPFQFTQLEAVRVQGDSALAITLRVQEFSLRPQIRLHLERMMSRVTAMTTFDVGQSNIYISLIANLVDRILGSTLKPSFDAIEDLNLGAAQLYDPLIKHLGRTHRCSQ